MLVMTNDHVVSGFNELSRIIQICLRLIKSKLNIKIME